MRSANWTICLLLAAIGGTTVVITVGVSLWFGHGLASGLGLSWFLAGPAFLISLALPLIAHFEKRGFDSERWAWLVQDLCLGVWLGIPLLIVGVAGGFAIRVGSIAGVALLVAAGMTLHYVVYMETNQMRAWEEMRGTAFTGVVLAVVGLLLFFVPTPQLIVFDWPCRPEQLAYEAAFAKWQEGDATWYDPRQEATRTFLGHKKWDALESWERCRGTSEEEIKSFRTLVEQIPTSLEQTAELLKGDKARGKLNLSPEARQSLEEQRRR
jgi:hypothetical protein